MARRLTGSLAAAITALVLLAASASAATITVTTTEDLFAATGSCSLREAIQAANTNAASGGCPAGTGADTIELPAGDYELSRVGNDDTNIAGDLDIGGGGPLTIKGAGQTASTVDARGIDRVFDVLAAATVTMEALRVTGGQARDGGASPNAAEGSAGVIPGGTGGSSIGGVGTPGANGGGIQNAGTLSLAAVTVTGNRAGNGGAGGNAGNGGNGGFSVLGNGGSAGASIGGVGAAGGSGGGVFSSGTLTVTASTISGNATGDGGIGGSAGNGGNGGSSFGGNGNGGSGGVTVGGVGGSGGNGGGIAAAGPLTISGSTITGNRTGRGGGSSTTGEGGEGGFGNGSGVGGSGGPAIGGVAASGGQGGGIFQSSATPATVTNTTVSGNRTGGGGEGESTARAGNGGEGGGGTGGGGTGGVSIGSVGGPGGNGAGISIVTGTVSGTTVSGNRTGEGGEGGEARAGGKGGGTGGGGGSAGSDGPSLGGPAGGGGSGGGVELGSAAGVVNSTITSNATGNGGNGGGGGPGPSLSIGGSGGPGGPGGGIFAAKESPVTTATVTANTTGSGGAGGGAGTGTTAFAGTAGASGTNPGINGTVLKASIVAFNGGVAGCAGGVPVADAGGNLTFPDASCPGTLGDPRLGPLADNGGPTRTRAIAPGSKAIDLAASGLCPATDQRGVGRPQGAACDAGAYELAPPKATTGDASNLATTLATLNGSVTPNGRATSYHFDYGTSTSYGSSTPTAQAGNALTAANVSAALAHLKPNTTYHFRLAATSPDGTSFGADKTFKTPQFTIKIVSKKAKVDGKGKATITISCPSNALTSCKGSIKLKAKSKKGAGKSAKGNKLIGKAKFTISAGKKAKIKVKIKKAGLQMINAAGGKGLKTTAEASAQDPEHNSAKAKRTIKLKH